MRLFATRWMLIAAIVLIAGGLLAAHALKGDGSPHHPRRAVGALAGPAQPNGPARVPSSHSSGGNQPGHAPAAVAASSQSGSDHTAQGSPAGSPPADSRAAKNPGSSHAGAPGGAQDAATPVNTDASAAGGGMAVSPGIVQHIASPGVVGTVKVSNTSASTMEVRVASRPWVQSRGGEVSPNRGRTLDGVRLSTASFTLPAATSQTVGISLSGRPAAGSLYGAVEVTGSPARRSTSSINVAYRVISSLRLDPPTGAQVFHARAGGLIEQGSVGHGTLLLAVRNAGNTIVPIGGAVRLSGEGHSLHAVVAAKAIVPGQTVNVALLQLLGSVPQGRYRVAVSLSQGGHRLGTSTHTIRLR